MIGSRFELPGGQTIEHGSTRAGRWLRVHRLRLAFAIAVVEGVLVAFDVIPWSVALLVAVGAVAFYFWRGRELRQDVARQASWVAAFSQLLVAFVPVLVVIVGTLAVIGVAILAVVALFVLFGDRR